jgi:HD-like signal output (HDOD) protein
MNTNISDSNNANENGKTALENLLAAMDAGGDFPALSRTITEINQAVGDENSRASKITEIILRDVSLTKKLLRLVNAAHYGSFGSQPISTISRAVVILGFNAVRNAAVSLMLFEHLQNHANVDLLRGEAVDSFFRGVLGRMLAAGAGVRDSEEAFISALFRDLGRLMARFHFYEQTEQISAQVEQELLDEQTASHQVLGASYDELGLAIARHWHFPPSILHAMTPLGEATLKKPGANENDRLQVVANMARDLHRSIAGKPAEEQAQALDSLYLRYRDAVQISHDSLMETARKAAQTLSGETAALNVDIRKSPLMQQLLQDPADTAAPEAPAGRRTREQRKRGDQRAGPGHAGHDRADAGPIPSGRHLQTAGGTVLPQRAVRRCRGQRARPRQPEPDRPRQPGKQCHTDAQQFPHSAVVCAGCIPRRHCQRPGHPDFRRDSG